MSCSYTGSHFGAAFDTACFDGYLWDLDSGDEDGLTHGGEIPCPACNLDKWLDHILEDISCGIPDDGDPYYPLMNKELHAARKIHPIDVLFTAMTGKILPHWIDSGIDDEPDGLIAWPWPVDDIPNLSAHIKMHLAEINPTDPSFVCHQGLWIKKI